MEGGCVMAKFEEFKVSGVTQDTPKHIMLNACTLYKNMTYDTVSSKWTGTLFGATSGGTKFSIVPEILNIAVDGVLVNAKGLVQKIGEAAKIETNMIELTKDWIKSTIIGQEGTSEDSRFDVIESKSNIEDGDYIENFAVCGFYTDKTPVMIIFDFALCTSGLEVEGKNKEAAVTPATFDCYADLSDGLTDKLPYHIYIPNGTQPTALVFEDGQ